MATRDEADRVLGEKRALQERRACYPCASRKVKCDRELPCKRCVKRGHPDICSVEATPERPTRRRRTAHGSSGEASASVGRATKDPHPSTTTTLEKDENDERDSAFYPTLAFHLTRDALASADADTASDVISPGHRKLSGDTDAGVDSSLPLELRSEIDLHNTPLRDPIIQHDTLEGVAAELDRLMPRHAEVLKYSQSYQNVISPFYPYVIESDEWDALTDKFLTKTSLRETHNIPIFDGSVTRKDVVDTCLLLAALASGAQFSDINAIQRIQISRDYGRRALRCAALANYRYYPTVDLIRALMTVGHTMQNNGQAESSWAFMGTVVRLAQTLGIHESRARPNISVVDSMKHRRLWPALILQDTILSLTFNRPPAAVFAHDEPPEFTREKNGLNFVEAVFAVAGIGRGMLQSSFSDRAVLSSIKARLARLDEIFDKTLPHLQHIDQCFNRQARAEHHLVHIQFSFSRVYLCRPALRGEQIRSQQPECCSLRRIAWDGLLETLHAFMDLQALTVVPLRNWTNLHSALGAALLLESFEEAADDKDAQALQAGLLAVVKEDLKVDLDALASNGGVAEQAFLSQPSVRSLRTLEDVVAKRRDQKTEFGQGSTDSPDVGSRAPRPADAASSSTAYPPQTPVYSHATQGVTFGANDTTGTSNEMGPPMAITMEDTANWPYPSYMPGPEYMMPSGVAGNPNWNSTGPYDIQPPGPVLDFGMYGSDNFWGC